MVDNWHNRPPPPSRPPPIPGAPPQQQPPRRRGRPTGVKPGGTAIDSSSPLPAIIAIVVILLGVVLFLVLRGGGGDDGAATATATAGEDAGATGEEPSTPDTPPTSVGPTDAQRAVAAAFKTALDKVQAVSDVSLAPAQPSVMLISSVYCPDSALRKVLTDQMADLRKAGINLVRCVSRDGTTVFEQKL